MTRLILHLRSILSINQNQFEQNINRISMIDAEKKQKRNHSEKDLRTKEKEDKPPVEPMDIEQTPTNIYPVYFIKKRKPRKLFFNFSVESSSTSE